MIHIVHFYGSHNLTMIFGVRVYTSNQSIVLVSYFQVRVQVLSDTNRILNLDRGQHTTLSLLLLFQIMFFLSVLSLVSRVCDGAEQTMKRVILIPTKMWRPRFPLLSHVVVFDRFTRITVSHHFLFRFPSQDCVQNVRVMSMHHHRIGLLACVGKRGLSLCFVHFPLFVDVCVCVESSVFLWLIRFPPTGIEFLKFTLKFWDTWKIEKWHMKEDRQPLWWFVGFKKRQKVEEKHGTGNWRDRFALLLPLFISFAPPNFLYRS